MAAPAPRRALISLECFERGSGAVDFEAIYEVGPTVLYNSKERPNHLWRQALQSALNDAGRDGADVTVRGRAPHRLYVWAGMAWGPGRKLGLGGFTMPAHVTQPDFPHPTTLHELGNKDPNAGLLFLGLPDTTFDQDSVPVIEDSMAREGKTFVFGSLHSARISTRNVTAENFAAVASEVASSTDACVRYHNERKTANLVVLLALPVELAAVAGVRLRPVICGPVVWVLERKGPADYLAA